MNLHNILRIDYGQCASECNACQEACEREGNRGGVGVIKSLHIPEVKFHGAVTCLQCAIPMCQDICPTGAIFKDEEDGVVRINQDRCVGCGLCTVVCPYGGVFFDPVTQKSVKCDYCDGDPKCVAACPQNALSFERTNLVVSHLGQDTLSPAMGQCQGCGTELGARFALRVLMEDGEDVVTAGGPGCSLSMLQGTEASVSRLGPGIATFMTNLPSTMTGVKRYYQKIGKKVRCVIFGGDGLTADVGFQPLSGAVERGEKLIYICDDNEAYMATGIQRSSTTPFKAWTTTTPVGKQKRGKGVVPKYVPLLLALQGAAYVATVSISHLEDFILKLEKAKRKVEEGFCYLHMLAPCPTGWRAPIDSTVEIARMAVETNYFPLWEAEGKRFRMTYPIANPRPLKEFTKLMGRFGHLSEEELREMETVIHERVTFIEGLCKLGEQNP